MKLKEICKKKMEENKSQTLINHCREISNKVRDKVFAIDVKDTEIDLITIFIDSTLAELKRFKSSLTETQDKRDELISELEKLNHEMTGGK